MFKKLDYNYLDVAGNKLIIENYPVQMGFISTANVHIGLRI